MGLDVFRTKSVGSVRINSDIADKLMGFEVENTNVCIWKKDAKKLLKEAKNKDEKHAFKEILNLFKKGDECIDLTIC